MKRIRCYASRTGTRRNLAALRTAGWGLFVSAAGVHRHEGFNFWIECAAWTWFMRGLEFQIAPYEKLLASHARDPLCEGIVAPDIVCGGLASLDLSLSWLDRLLEYGPRIYLPVQPGIDPADVEAVIGPRVGVFVGGDSEWKEATAAFWSRLAHERGALCHVGRVNSARRLAICQRAGVDSIDGSGPSRFEKHLHEMEAARAVAVQVGLVLQVHVDVELPAGVIADHEHVDVTFTADAIVLAAIAAGVEGEVLEIQADDGIHRRIGDKFRFDTWSQLEAMEAAGTHYLMQQER